MLAGLIATWAWTTRFGTGSVVTSSNARIVDGDTLLLDGKEWRLNGIDAPEYRQTCRDAGGGEWPCGQAARLQLATIVGRAAVTCRAQGTDRYGRHVADCETATVPDLGEAMVEAGYAISLSSLGWSSYSDAESSARNAKRGIWQGEFETPADWRKQNPREDST